MLAEDPLDGDQLGPVPGDPRRDLHVECEQPARHVVFNGRLRDAEGDGSVAEKSGDHTNTYEYLRVGQLRHDSRSHEVWAAGSLSCVAASCSLSGLWP